MAQPVEQHELASPRKRGDDGEIGHVSRGEQQRALTPRVCGKLLFQSVVLDEMTGHQV